MLFRSKVNNRKVLDGVLDAIGLGGDDNAGKRLTVLRAIDKYDRLGIQGVHSLLRAGRKDESGDFTKGANLTSMQVRGVLTYIQSMIPTGQRFDEKRNRRDLVLHAQEMNWVEANNERIPVLDDQTITLGEMQDLFAANALFQKGVNELQEIAAICGACSYDEQRVRIDPSVVRGLEYYTGPVYEVEFLLETKDEKGRPVRFGSVGGGGRYDGLVSRFRGEPVPATGFSIGVSRLQAALTMIGKLDSKPAPGPVLVTAFDRDRVADYQKMAAALRNARIRAELYLGNPKHSVGQQLKYADKRGAPCAIIQGGDEKAKGEVQIKDLILGATLTDTKDREEYLKKQAEAQFAVNESELVDGVRRVLAKHNIRWT